MPVAELTIARGTLVEYLLENQPVLGFVLESQGSQLRVLNINKRLVKLQPSRVLPWFGPSFAPESSREDILNLLSRHQERRLLLQEGIEPLDLWELTQEEVETASIHWLAGLMWSDPESDHLAALGRALLQAKTHFRFSPPSFHILPRSKVEAKLQEQEEARRKNEIILQGRELFQALWKQRNNSVSPELPQPHPEIRSRLQDLLRQGIANPDDTEFLELWTWLRQGLPDQPHLPLQLAQAWGLVPRHYNHLLDLHGYSWGDEWSTAFQSEIRQQEALFQEQAREPERLPLLSIDSASTRDIDDAFALHTTAAGHFHLQLAFACPVLFWEFGSELDSSVAHRASSLYLPEGTSHMLPERLGIDLYSLQAGQTRPVLLLDLLLDPQGNLQQCSPRITWTRVQRNSTYAQTERELSGFSRNSFLSNALDLAAKLRQRRVDWGAAILEQQEPIIRLLQQEQGLDIQLDEPPTYPRAQILVSEFMILANWAISQWARDRGIPLLHRTQDISLPRECAGVWRDPFNIYQVIREMSSSRLDTQPRPHASLGLQAYTPISSPLRRYVDFLNVAQISSFLQSGSPQWSQQELESMLPHVSARSQSVTKIQKFRCRYWKLLYFQRWCKLQSWTGIVVDEEPNQITLMLPREQIMLKAPKSLVGEKITPGQRLRLRLGKIDPLNNQIKVLNTWEE